MTWGVIQGADAEALDEATRALREDLLVLDVLDVRAPYVPVADVARAVDAVAAGTLLVTLDAGVLAIIARAVHAWIERGGAPSAVLQVGPDRNGMPMCDYVDNRDGSWGLALQGECDTCGTCYIRAGHWRRSRTSAPSAAATSARGCLVCRRSATATVTGPSATR